MASKPKPTEPDPSRELLKWYMERAQQDEHANVAGHEKRIQFLSGLNIAVLTAVGAGLLHATRWDHYVVLLLGPGFMLVTNHFAAEACQRYYNRVLEAISVKAHVEQALGLTKPLPVPQDAPEPYWDKEPPVPQRHLEARRRYGESSARWFDAVKGEGSQAFVRKLFWAYQALAVALALLILIMLCHAAH